MNIFSWRGVIGVWSLVLMCASCSSDIRIHEAISQCAHYTASPNWVAYDEDPANVAKLRANADYTFDTRDVDPPSALFHPPCMTDLDKWTSTSPDDLDSWMHTAATLFVHELQTKSGTRRLVEVSYVHYLEHSAGNDFFYFHAAMLDTAAQPDQPVWVSVDTQQLDSDSNYIFPEEAWHTPGYLTIYAGQMDPFDPARFSIRCRRGQQDGFVDGWLEDTPAGPTLRLGARCQATMSPQDRLAYSKQLEEYSPAASEIVFEDHPDKAGKLLSVPGSKYIHPRWYELDEAEAALSVPSVWRNYFVPPQSSQWGPGPVLFLGGRSVGGINRIIRVDLDGLIDWSVRRMWPEELVVTVLSSATAETPIAILGAAERRVTWAAELKKPVRFFAGQRDAKDASHFTIGYEYHGQAGTLDGWLQPDGVSVRFKGWPEKPLYDYPDEAICGGDGQKIGGR